MFYTLRPLYPILHAFCFKPPVSLSAHLHLAVLTVKSQAKALAVRPYQVVGFPVRGVSLLMCRTPAHAVTQAMLTEHEYGFGYGLLLVCRFHGSYSVSQIKAAGGGIHHIAQICQGLHRETMAGGFPHVQLTTVSNAAGGSQLVYHLATPVCYHRGGYEPVLRQVDRNSGSSPSQKYRPYLPKPRPQKGVLPLICQAGYADAPVAEYAPALLDRGKTRLHGCRLHLRQSGQSPKGYLPAPTPMPILRSADLRARMRSNS